MPCPRVPLLLCILAAPGAGLTQGSPSAERKPLLDKVRAVLATKPSFRDTITVDGRRVDQLEVMRQMVYHFGRGALKQQSLHLATEAEIAARVAAGADPRTFAVSDEEVDAELKALARKAGGRDAMRNHMVAQGLTEEVYRKRLRAQLRFDKTFLNGPPATWPETTKRAIREAGERGQKLMAGLPGARGLPDTFRPIVRAWVGSSLRKHAKVRYADDGLPPEHCLSVGGQVWKTRDALRELGDRVGRREHELALADVALSMLARRELEKRGAWLDDDALRADFEKYRAPYDKTPFTVETMALSFKGYPSFAVYRARWRIAHCFERMIAGEIDGRVLEGHLKRARVFLGGGSVGIDLLRIPVSARAGFATAKAEAQRIRAALDAGEYDFLDAVDKFSKWQGKPPKGTMSLNELRRQLGEGEYTDFFAPSVADALFYDTKQNSVVGPLRGLDAYYLARVNSHDPAGAGGLTLANADTRKLVVQDYVAHRFSEWLRKLGEAAKLE